MEIKQHAGHIIIRQFLTKNYEWYSLSGYERNLIHRGYILGVAAANCESNFTKDLEFILNLEGRIDIHDENVICKNQNISGN